MLSFYEFATGTLGDATWILGESYAGVILSLAANLDAARQVIMAGIHPERNPK